MNSCITRRSFIQKSAAASLALGVVGAHSWLSAGSKSLPYRISLAQWSLNRSFFGGVLDPLYFAKITREEFDISGIEYVNQFFKDKAKDKSYLNQLNTIAKDHGVSQVLIMIDGEGQLGDADKQQRIQAVENHYAWVDAAHHLGCHSIRVNAGGQGSREELADAVVDGLSRLSDYGAQAGINVIVENHGGFSSDGAWLANVIGRVGKPNCGTLPDFGNFCVERKRNTDGGWECTNEYDRYQGMEDLMPFAKAVSAKAHAFDANGDESNIDFRRIMKTVTDAGYHSWVGIEFEGPGEEMDGIRKTRDLLIRVREEMMV